MELSEGRYKWVSAVAFIEGLAIEPLTCVRSMATYFLNCSRRPILSISSINRVDSIKKIQEIALDILLYGEDLFTGSFFWLGESH